MEKIVWRVTLGKILFYFVKMTRARFCFLWCKYLSKEFVAILLKINPVTTLSIEQCSVTVLLFSVETQNR